MYEFLSKYDTSIGKALCNFYESVGSNDKETFSNIYAKRINDGEITIENVPTDLKEDVEGLFEESEICEDAEPTRINDYILFYDAGDGFMVGDIIKGRLRHSNGFYDINGMVQSKKMRVGEYPSVATDNIKVYAFFGSYDDKVGYFAINNSKEELEDCYLTLTKDVSARFYDYMCYNQIGESQGDNATYYAINKTWSVGDKVKLTATINEIEYKEQEFTVVKMDAGENATGFYIVEDKTFFYIDPEVDGQVILYDADKLESSNLTIYLERS